MAKENERNAYVEYKNNLDGSENPKYIDLLDEDKPIAGQKFACISFISPDKIIRQKDMFFFEEFLKQFDLNKSLEKFTQFLNFISFKYHVDFDKMTKDLEEFVKEEKVNLHKTTLDDEYKNFIDAHEEKLEEKYKENYGFQTSTRGLKIRGVYPNEQEAELRCKILRELDPHHDIYVGPVGMWIPWEPEAYKTGRVEYLEDELNQLMNEKQKNEKTAKMEFDKRVREAKEKAMEENRKKAEESGNVLTQTITKDGELVNIKNLNTTEMNLLENGEEVSDESIRKQLFEGDDIVTDKNNDHGLSQLNLGDDTNFELKKEDGME
ncbi:MAG: DUF5832 domain-containing protein [Planctomycetota bacterium]|jgi:hypothetical protein